MASIKDLKNAVEQQEASVTVVIYQPSKDPYLAPDGSECTISVVGEESRQYRRVVETNQRKIMRGGRAKLTPALQMERRIEEAAAAVTGWHGWTTDDGKKALDCTPENVKGLLQVLHVLRQVETAIHDHADFFDPASTS